MTHDKKPPPTLVGARVLEYAVVEGTQYCGQGTHFVGNKEVGPVPCLAICQSPENSKVHLLHCERDWSVVAFPSYDSVQDAKDSAECDYPSSSDLWIAAHVTEADAAKHLAEIWGGPMRCNFCGKRPIDFEEPRFIEKNGSWICEPCVRACYEMDGWPTL